MKLKGFEVVEHQKSSDDYREVYLSETAKCILDLVRQINQKYGHKCGDYLFVEGKKRINHYSIERRIIRGCETIGINIKTMHKVMKTYISTLIDAGVNIDEINYLIITVSTDKRIAQ